MSFDNSYQNRKDWRKPYSKSKAFDRTCRPGGACSYCREQRLHCHAKRARHADAEIAEYQRGEA